jgi:DNA ligase 1
VLLADLVAASNEVAETAARSAKVRRLAAVLAAAGPDEVVPAVGFLTGEPRQGSVGVGWASLRSEVAPSAEPTLTVGDLDVMLDSLAGASGPGSRTAKAQVLGELMGRATPDEQRFVRNVLLGELRQGALGGVMVEAVAAAASVPAASVRRALMLTGDLGMVAETALATGRAGLSAFGLEVLRPIQPMLAQSADDLSEAMARFGSAGVEWKLDGARIQAHRAGDEVRVFTRSLADMTERAPEVVEVLLALPVDTVILDGEAIVLRSDARPLPFQETMSRFGTQTENPVGQLVPFFFDCLHLDGDDLLDLPLHRRSEALRLAVPEVLRVPGAVAGDLPAAQAILDQALDLGHEGVMVKALDAAYEAGRRGASWVKVKPVLTLDLVILAAEWGHGRRQGWLSNLHLGARDPAGGFVMLGKTFKGLTDEMLTWQTETLLGLAIDQGDYVVTVRPELVVEVAFDGVQASSRYPGGVALRFARVKGYRPDKGPAEADTIDSVRALHQRGR